MSDSLKKKTTSALSWNAFDKVGFQVIALIVGIISARLLSQEDFGLIGALAIFTLLSNVLIESGFTATFIRRENNSPEEYSAVFYFNITLSVLLYLILYFSAPYIALFFNRPELTSLSRFLFLAIIINSFGLVQTIILSKELAFKSMAFANIAAVTLSGGITVALILNNFGYWALAAQQVMLVGFKSFFLWIVKPWKLLLTPRFGVIKEVLNFSLLLIISNVFSIIVRNIYNVIIGRVFTMQQLGYYTQAQKFQQIPSYVISSTQSGVALPVLSKLNNNPKRQLTYIRKIVRITAFLIFPVMLGLFSMAEEFITLLLTEKWLPSVPFFKILLISGIFAPFHILYLNIVIVKGSSKLNLILEFIKNALILLSLLLGIKDIELMLYGFTAATFLSLIIDAFVIQKKVGYKSWWQLTDVAPYAIISVIMMVIVYAVGTTNISLFPKLLLQVISGGAFYLITLKLFGSKIVEDIMKFVFKKAE